MTGQPRTGDRIRPWCGIQCLPGTVDFLLAHDLLDIRAELIETNPKHGIKRTERPSAGGKSIQRISRLSGKQLVANGKGTERAREAALVTSGLSIASVGHARPHATWTTALLPLTWKSRDRHPPRKIACSHLDQNRAHLRCGTLSSGTMLHEAPAGWPLHPPTSRQSSSKTIRFPPVNPGPRKPDFRVVISVAQSGFQTLWYRCRNVPTKPVHIRS